MNYLNNETYFSFVEFIANNSQNDMQRVYVSLKTELGLISGKCGCKDCKTDPNYIGALDQALKLLAECKTLDQFKKKLAEVNL